MNKLLKFKDWLTLDEVKDYLSIVFEGKVTKADVLRLSLDGYITLSIYLINDYFFRELLKVDMDNVEFETKASTNGEVYRYVKDGDVMIFDDCNLQIKAGMIQKAQVVFDLTYLGNEKFLIENLYQQMVGSAEVDLFTANGIILKDIEGEYFQLIKHIGDIDDIGRETVSPWYHPDNFELAIELPKNANLVVRTKELLNFEKSIMNKDNISTVKNKVLNTRLENNYLKLILSLANGIKDFNPKNPYEAAQLILDETEIDLSKETLAGYISKAYDLEIKNRD